MEQLSHEQVYVYLSERCVRFEQASLNLHYMEPHTVLAEEKNAAQLIT